MSRKMKRGYNKKSVYNKNARKVATVAKLVLSCIIHGIRNKFSSSGWTTPRRRTIVYVLKNAQIYIWLHAKRNICQEEWHRKNWSMNWDTRSSINGNILMVEKSSVESSQSVSHRQSFTEISLCLRIWLLCNGFCSKSQHWLCDGPLCVADRFVSFFKESGSFVVCFHCLSVFQAFLEYTKCFENTH